MEKRVGFTIDSHGNVTFKTISGFAGESCVHTAEQLMVSLNGTELKGGDTDDRYREAESSAFSELG